MTERLHRSSQAVHNSHPLYRKVEGSIHSGRARRVFSRQCRNSLHSGRTRWVIVLQYERATISRDAQQFKAGLDSTQMHVNKHGMVSVQNNHGIST